MKKRPCSGFTLVEVIFAVAVVAVAIIGVAGTMLISLRHQESARQADIAHNIVQDQIERIRATEFSTILTAFAAPNDTFVVPGLPSTSGDPLNPDAQGRITIQQLAPDLLDVTVEVSWPGAVGGGVQSTSRLRTQIFGKSS